MGQRSRQSRGRGAGVGRRRADVDGGGDPRWRRADVDGGGDPRCRRADVDGRRGSKVKTGRRRRRLERERVLGQQTKADVGLRRIQRL